MTEGVKESTEFLLMFLKSLNGLGKSLQDGKLSLTDSMYFLSAVKEAPAAFSGMGKIPAELADLDDAEKSIMKQLIEKELDLPQDQVEEYLEQALKLLVSVADLVRYFGGKKDK